MRQALADLKPRIHLVAIPDQCEVISSSPSPHHVHLLLLPDHEVIVGKVPLDNLSLNGRKQEEARALELGLVNMLSVIYHLTSKVNLIEENTKSKNGRGCPGLERE